MKNSPKLDQSKYLKKKTTTTTATVHLLGKVLFGSFHKKGNTISP